jgi:protein SCO1/2
MSPRQRLIAALLGLATLVVIAFAQRGLPWPDQRPIPWVAPTPTSLADLELDDGAGHAVGAEILAGHWTVVAVGYTSCPDVCPTALARLADAVSREPTLAAAFLAVDPVRDRAHLAAYVAAFHPAIRGLTGTPAQLDRAVAALGATYVDNRDGTFDHSAAVFVVDPQGNLAGALPAPRDGAEIVAGVSALRDTWRPALEIELWTPRQPGPVGVGYGRFKNRGDAGDRRDRGRAPRRGRPGPDRGPRQRGGRRRRADAPARDPHDRAGRDRRAGARWPTPDAGGRRRCRAGRGGDHRHRRDRGRAAHPRRPWGWMTRGRWISAALAVWAVVVIAIAAQLAVGHAGALPGPRDRAALVAATSAVAQPGARQAIHVIPARCSCTRLLVSHLARRGPRPGWAETVIVAGGIDPAPLRAAGFAVHAVAPSWPGEVARLDAAPVVTVLIDGRLAWTGGYFDTPAANRPRDVAILAAVEDDRPLAGKPVFGCAVSAGLRRRLDPGGLLGW